MELTGAAALRRPLAVVPGQRTTRRAPSRVSCVGRASFADEAHLRYYEAAPRKAVEAAARDLSRLRAMGLVAGDAAKEKILSEATELLFQELSRMKYAEDELKREQKEEKVVMKALKKQQKETKKAAMECGDGSSESSESESECEEGQSMKMSCVATTSLMPGTEQGMMMSMSLPQIAAVPAMDFDKAAMKAMKKMEKEQKKAAKKALKMKKEEEKRMAMLNGCKDEDSSSCSSESSDSECQTGVLKMSRCATVTAPPASTVFPIIVPQISDTVALDNQVSPGPANAVQSTTTTTTTGIALNGKTQSSIEVCMGGKCKKSGSLAILQEFEKKMGTDSAVGRCKCLGKCGEGPNVRMGSVREDALIWTGVGFDDVGDVVAGVRGWGGLGI